MVLERGRQRLGRVSIESVMDHLTRPFNDARVEITGCGTEANKEANRERYKQTTSRSDSWSSDKARLEYGGEGHPIRDALLQHDGSTTATI